MFELVANILKVLNSETDPGQISLAACLGMVIGLTPLMSLHNLLVLLLALILRVNLTIFIVAWGLFSAIAYLLDPLFHLLGLNILNLPALSAAWTAAYNTTLFRLAHFNNSIVMGSLVCSLALFLPVFLLLNTIIRKYREHILGWMPRTGGKPKPSPVI